MKEIAKEVRERIERVEDVTDRGSYEHSQYLKAALEIEWPRLRTILRHVESE